MKTWIMIVGLALATSAFAQKKNECQMDCDDENKECVEGCKREIKKINPAVASYCAPKCNDAKKQCLKDCADEAQGKKLDDLE